jgi:uncharacterized protein (DUF2267 family)
MTQTIANTIVSRIYGWGRAWAFSQADFADLASATTVNSVLRRLVEGGTIRRVFTGMYDYPRYSDLLEQTMAPDVFQVAQALARKFGWRIQPDGAAALSLMRLSTQIPAQYLFHSDGPSRQYEIGKTKLDFKRVATKEMNFKHHESAVIVHGLKALGQEHIDEAVIQKVRDWLPTDKRKKVLRDTRTVTDWVHAAIRRICVDLPDG